MYCNDKRKRDDVHGLLTLSNTAQAQQWMTRRAARARTHARTQVHTHEDNATLRRRTRIWCVCTQPCISQEQEQEVIAGPIGVCITVSIHPYQHHLPSSHASTLTCHTSHFTGSIHHQSHYLSLCMWKVTAQYPSSIHLIIRKVLSECRS